jgi:hypothetical protein
VNRTTEESCVLIDTIVGRCVRDGIFALRVLDDPDGTLAEYHLNEDELDDFRILAAEHREYCLEGWKIIREAMDLQRNLMKAKTAAP